VFALVRGMLEGNFFDGEVFGDSGRLGVSFVIFIRRRVKCPR
jgi:hypothetical protein